MSRPSALLILLLAASLLLAGCTGLAPTDGAPSPAEPSPTDPSPTATATPTPTDTPDSPATPTDDPTPGTPHYGPEPNHDVVVENRLDGEVTLHVRVSREATNETVYDEAVTLPPGERVVYNTAEADPDGIESFRVVAERGGDRASVTIETSECYGDAIVSATDDGGVDATYSVC
jgi:hypothetical protein